MNGTRLLPLLAACALAQAACDDSKDFTTAIAGAEKLMLHEGLPHHHFEPELLARERANKPVQELHAHWFYKEPIAPSVEDAQRLTKILSDPGTFKSHSGEKLCGGYHPDYAAEWQRGSSTYRALICLGCSEVKLYGPGVDKYKDLSPRAHDELRALLTKYRKHRPSEGSSPLDAGQAR